MILALALLIATFPVATAVTAASVAECHRPEAFSTAVIVEHETTEMKANDPDELKNLSKVFKETYNAMNAPRETEEICDTMFRAVDSVTVTPMKMAYVQYENQESYYRPFLYKVSGSCVNCDVTTGLFDLGKARPTNALVTLAKSDAPTCQCSSSMIESRGPTEGEFRKAMKKAVQKLYNTAEILQNAESTQRVVEVESGSCPSLDDSWSYLVDVHLDREPSTQDLPEVEKAAQNAYNYMIPVYCDPDHHVMTDAKFTDSTRRRRLGSKNRKLGKKKRLNVSGNCRNCKNGKPYDDGSRRLAEDIQRARTLWQTTGCFCSVNAQGYRRPTVGEFALQLNKTLTFAYNNGFISEPIRLESVVEVSEGA